MTRFMAVFVSSVTRFMGMHYKQLYFPSRRTIRQTRHNPSPVTPTTMAPARSATRGLPTMTRTGHRSVPTMGQDQREEDHDAAA